MSYYQLLLYFIMLNRIYKFVKKWKIKSIKI